MKTFIKFAILLTFLFSAQKAPACSCNPLPAVYESFEDAGAVFVGKVVSSNEDSIARSGVDVVFTFDVVEAFKGVQGKQVKLNRGRKDSSCYSGYSVGETYLIYAYSDGADFLHQNKGPGFFFQSSFCHRSDDIRSAQDQIHFIRQMLNKQPEDQIYGSVARSDTDPESHKWRNTYLDKMKVVLEGKDGRNFETVTDAKGLFKFNNIPEGEYLLKPALPAGYRPYWPGSESIRVLADKSVESKMPWMAAQYSAFYTEFTVGWNNSFEGRVLDPNGVALERYVINLLPTALANNKMPPETLERSPDSHGPEHTYRIHGRTPGKYVLALDVYGPFGNAVKKRYFYPQAEVSSKAQIFDITDTTKLEKMEFKIPLTLGAIKGQAVWSDGSPVSEGGWITLRALETADDNLNTNFDWKPPGKDGKFSIQAIEGLEYWVEAVVSVQLLVNGKEMYKEVTATPVKVKLSKDSGELKIIFQKPLNLVAR